MKRVVIGLSFLALLGGVAGTASAQPRDLRHDRREIRHDRRELRQDRREAHHDRRQARSWRRGERLPLAYRGPAYYVGDYRAHRLRPPPRGYRWMRRDNDFLLVAATTGLIASVIAASR